ncbi:short chain dehydrogenase [Streptomyces sp. cf124]|uniref:SDR family oxidoreductase n=1 Tax=Streptomyces TaxID=1883 RepID=UPI0008E35475|nr:SDR family oxidoreductase [Streptomyces sp. cf124]SFM54843.1 short chain dehydrogenase [Streptomyces sp. cf124]
MIIIARDPDRLTTASDLIGDGTIVVVAVLKGLRLLLAPGGAVVFRGSAADRRGGEGIAAYGAGKAAPEHLTRILAAEIIGEGIRVDIVIPGG